MFFICENRKIIAPNVQSTEVYQSREYAETILKQKDKNVKMWDVGKPPVKHSVEGFYLIHESFFDDEPKE